MKILIISWYFPPVNTIGALRAGQFARFLDERGHEIRVIAGSGWGQPETLPVTVRPEQVCYARTRDVNAIPRWVNSALRRSAPPAQPASDAAGGGRRSLLGRIGEFYQHLTNVPDQRIGWLPSAYRAGRRITREWQPDVVFASGPPFTGLVVAKLLSRRIHRPWIAELRDSWGYDPYDLAPPWRLRLNRWTERRTLDSATGLVTISQPWEEFYRSNYAKPVVTVYNGYDADDFPEHGGSYAPRSDDKLVIGYTGGIYPGRRDPTPLFEALQKMGTAREKIRVVFVGTNPGHVLPLAQKAHVQQCVEIRPQITHAEALAFQQSVDVLLLMQWNDPRDQGTCPGKFFEYIASLRPILLLGLADGIPATIMRQRGAGFCLNDPDLIAAQLRKWQSQKETLGCLPSLPQSVREGLSRTTQFILLEQFLMDCVHTGDPHTLRMRRGRAEPSTGTTTEWRSRSPSSTRH